MLLADRDTTEAKRRVQRIWSSKCRKEYPEIIVMLGGVSLTGAGISWDLGLCAYLSGSILIPFIDVGRP